MTPQTLTISAAYSTAETRTNIQNAIKAIKTAGDAKTICEKVMAASAECFTKVKNGRNAAYYIDWIENM